MTEQQPSPWPTPGQPAVPDWAPPAGGPESWAPPPSASSAAPVPGWPPPAASGAAPVPGWPPPAPGQGYPGWPPAPARRRRWVLWLVLAGLVVVGGCAGVVGMAAFRGINGADHAVNDFLNAAQRGDTAAALRHACPDATANDVPSPRWHKVRGVSVVSGGGETTAEVRVDVAMADGTVHHDVVHLEKHAGTWLVCGVQRETP